MFIYIKIVTSYKMLHYKQSDGYAGGLNLSLNMVIFVICEVKGKLQPNIFQYLE